MSGWLSNHQGAQGVQGEQGLGKYGLGLFLTEPDGSVVPIPPPPPLPMGSRSRSWDLDDTNNGNGRLEVGDTVTINGLSNPQIAFLNGCDATVSRLVTRGCTELHVGARSYTEVHGVTRSYQRWYMSSV